MQKKTFMTRSLALSAAGVLAMTSVTVAQPREPAPPGAGQRARVVFLHASHAVRDRAFSAWRSRIPYTPLVTDVAFGRWAVAEVEPGSQGFAGRLAGMEPPTAARLGWNTGLGSPEAGRTYFVVVTGGTTDRVDTRSHNPPGADAGAVGRILGLWTGPVRVDVCAVGRGAPVIPARNLGGTGYMAPLSAPLAGTITVRATAASGACAGNVLATFEYGSAGEPEAAFVFGSTDGGLQMVACTESGGACRAVRRAP